MLFGEEQRPSITAKLRAEAPAGKVAVTLVAKAIGELWKALSDEDKASYKEKAQARAVGEHSMLLHMQLGNCCSRNRPKVGTAAPSFG
jgi:hypothetical protein